MSGHRYFHADKGPAFGGPQKRESAAHKRRTLAHGDDAEATAARFPGEARAVIFDFELEDAAVTTQTNGGARGAGMSGHVAQGFLQHSIHLDANFPAERGQRIGRALIRYGDTQLS